MIIISATFWNIRRKMRATELAKQQAVYQVKVEAEVKTLEENKPVKKVVKKNGK